MDPGKLLSMIYANYLDTAIFIKELYEEHYHGEHKKCSRRLKVKSTQEIVDLLISIRLYTEASVPLVRSGGKGYVESHAAPLNLYDHNLEASINMYSIGYDPSTYGIVFEDYDMYGVPGSKDKNPNPDVLLEPARVKELIDVIGPGMDLSYAYKRRSGDIISKKMTVTNASEFLTYCRKIIQHKVNHMNPELLVFWREILKNLKKHMIETPNASHYSSAQPIMSNLANQSPVLRPPHALFGGVNTPSFQYGSKKAIYRGLTLTPAAAADLLLDVDNTSRKIKLATGAVFEMNGITSTTYDDSTATGFISQDQKKPYGILLKIPNPVRGSYVAPFAGEYEHEEEVISTGNLIVESIEEVEGNDMHTIRKICNRQKKGSDMAIFSLILAFHANAGADMAAYRKSILNLCNPGTLGRAETAINGLLTRTPFYDITLICKHT